MYCIGVNPPKLYMWPESVVLAVSFFEFAADFVDGVGSEVIAVIQLLL